MSLRLHIPTHLVTGSVLHKNNVLFIIFLFVGFYVLPVVTQPVLISYSCFRANNHYNYHRAYNDLSDDDW